MIGLRLTLGTLLLMTSAMAFGQSSSRSPMGAKATEGLTGCNSSSLPSDIQTRLKADFGSWTIQEAKSLSEYARKTWAGKKPQACPGIAVGLFQSTKTPSYAVLLVPVDHPDAGCRFLVFTRKNGEPSYETRVVEQYDDHGASSYFIRKAPISRFFNEEYKREFQVRATDAILMVDSAEQEYEADI